MMPDHSAATHVLGALLEARTGQQLVAGRQWRVETALRPVARELKLDSVDTLVATLVSGRDDALMMRVVDALLNNETSFYRDPGVFDLLNSVAFDRLHMERRDSRRLRIWSAGCSTGQEAYTIAMLLREADARWAGWSVEITATDVSDTVIQRARQGRYSQFEIQRGLPVRTMLRWFQQEGEEWVVDSRLRRMIRFATHNLIDPAPGQYDIILCRNVLMYFAPPVRAGVFDRLADALAPGGVLILGAGETVIGQTSRFAAHPGLRGFYTAATRPGSVQSKVA